MTKNLSAIVDELSAILKRAKPAILDRQRKSNVYSLDDSAYRHMKE